MPHMLILADDLSGAADCGITCVQAGLDTCVVMDDEPAPETIDVLAIDTDTRAMSSESATKAVQDALSNHLANGTLLYKKIDSTLRGHLLPELAATFAALTQAGRKQPVAVFAPAFPASGRTTVNGFQLVQGELLHETEIWKREAMTGRAFLPEMLAGDGIRSSLLLLETIRQGRDPLLAAMRHAAQTANTLICDAETDRDLRTIAEASVQLETAFWVGSAGLAHHLPYAAGLDNEQTQVFAPLATHGPAIFAVGSLSTASRDQAELLSAMPGVVRIEVSPETLLKNPDACEAIGHEMSSVLESGNDLLLLLSRGATVDMRQAPALAAAIGSLLRPLAAHAGALVATGGETARAILEAWDVHHLHLRRELEPGLPISVAEINGRSVPVLTKAGGFGRPHTLTNCLEFLRKIRSEEESIPHA